MRFSDTIEFCWATGIEDTFIPQERPGLRALDEYELTQHYTQWEGDAQRVADAGSQAVRWGIPWYRVQPERDKWDWDWTDRVLDALVNKHGIIPIIDMMHYGTPLWLDNSFINADYPQRVAEYMGRVAERYASLTHWYTPHNEPIVNAEFCGQKGEWPPYLVGRDGFTRIAVAVAKGMALGSQAIRAADPAAKLLQVEAMWHFYTSNPTLQEQVQIHNDSAFLAWDLATGTVGEEYSLLPLLRHWGVTDADLAWFKQHKTHFDMIGVNYYPWSWGEYVSDGKGGHTVKSGAPNGGTLRTILDKVHARYNLPMMITETSALYDVEGRARWMDETIAAVRAARADGLPVVGYTWFPIMTMFDWLYRTGDKPLEEYAIHLGLYDSVFNEEGLLERHATPLVQRFREYATGVR